MGRHFLQHWPSMTTAMLDGEKRVCLPSKGITIAETVDTCAWKIRATAEMTPGRDLADIKVIFADGIVIGETLLQKLGIQSTCALLLDQHHLVSEDLGTWPKFFELCNWNLLKEALMIMVKTPSEAVHLEALERVRRKLSHNAEWLDHLNNWIHGKRHMSAHHLIKDIPGVGCLLFGFMFIFDLKRCSYLRSYIPDLMSAHFADCITQKN